MEVCTYCGEPHKSKTCPIRFTLPIDPYGILKLQIRKRKSRSICSYCEGSFPVGGLEVTQSRKRLGVYIKTSKAHWVCYLGAMEELYWDYIHWVERSKEETREQSRRLSRERYRKSKEVNPCADPRC